MEERLGRLEALLTHVAFNIGALMSLPKEVQDLLDQSKAAVTLLGSLDTAFAAMILQNKNMAEQIASLQPGSPLAAEDLAALEATARDLGAAITAAQAAIPANLSSGTASATSATAPATSSSGVVGGGIASATSAVSSAAGSAAAPAAQVTSGGSATTSASAPTNAADAPATSAGAPAGS